MIDQSLVIVALYLAAVVFFALWRCERERRIEFTRLVWDAIGRHQMAALRACEAEGFDVLREIV